MEAKENSIKDSKNSGDQKLPLQGFFDLLKANRFTITPGQIEDTNRIIIAFADSQKNENELCAYLSPLFSTNKIEQQQFQELFASYFKQIPPEPPRPLPWKKWIIAALLIAVLLFIGYSFCPQFLCPSLPTNVSVQLLDSSADEKTNVGQEPFQVTTIDSLQIKFQIDAGNDIVSLRSKIDWGDGTKSDSLHSHQYTKSGVFILNAFVQAFSGNLQVTDTTIRQTIKVCDQKNTLTIQSPNESYSIKTGENKTWSAKITGNKPQSVQWLVNDTIKGQGLTFSSSFEKAGPKRLECFAIYDSLTSPCTLHYNKDFRVEAHQLYHAHIKPSDNAVKLAPRYKYEVKEYWYWLISCIIVLSATLTTYFFNAFLKAQKKQMTEKATGQKYYSQFIDSISSGRPPFVLPFKSKDYLTYPESDLNAMSRLMQKRIESEASYLHLWRTIQKSILSAGLFQPVFAPRSLQSEYLVLVDRNYPNGQQVSLFRFLLSYLQSRNVLIEKYYYQSDPAVCNRGKADTEISLESLSDKYPNHILVIIGDGQQLLNPYYPIFNRTYLPLLRRWERRALLTPVPVADWGQREFKALQPHIPVYPADANGLLLLMRTYFEGNINLQAEFEQIKNSSYSIEKFDFEEVEDLQTYCSTAEWASREGNSNLLFQWIAALALYPKIRWELIIAIGKSVLDKHHKAEELNFTNLLRIARISWINHGQFPDNLRLELLKALEEENELAAREALLTCLNETPEIDETSFAFEEKEIQRITNEFVLYAYDPEKYSAYKKSEQIFKELHNKSEIRDTSTKLYLENKESWKTLLKGRLKNSKHSIPLKEFLDQKHEVRKSRFLIPMAFLALAILGMIALAIISSSKKHVPPFTTTTAVTNPYNDIRFTLILGDSVLNSPVTPIVRIDTMKKFLQANSPVSFSLPFDNKQRSLELKVDFNIVLDTNMYVDYNSYSISLEKIIPSTKPISPRFDVYIQYADELDLRPIRKLRDCINGGIFNSPAEEKIDNIVRNEIRYYNRSFIDSLNELQKCLALAFPGKEFTPVFTPLRHNKNARAEIWIANSTIKTAIGRYQTILGSTLLAMRSRPLTREEINISNACNVYVAKDGTTTYDDTKACDRRKKLDNETDIGFIKNNEIVDLLAEKEGFYLVRVVRTSFEGWMSAGLNGENTLQKIVDTTLIVQDTSVKKIITKKNNGSEEGVTYPDTSRILANILWADDASEKNKGLRVELEAMGYQITLVSSSEDALNKLKKSSFDLIISDISLGRYITITNQRGSSGIKISDLDQRIYFLRQAKRLYPQIPFIVYDFYKEFDSENVLESGADYVATNGDDDLFKGVKLLLAKEKVKN